jgi:hypothetical protein
MKKNIILMLIVLLNISCSDRKDGDWDNTIKISQKEFQFNSLENSAVITTEGDSWWISEVFFKDGQTFDFRNVDTTFKNLKFRTSKERKNIEI